MTTSLIAPAAQVCAFALGCALIHAARAHALALSRVLAATALVTALLVLLSASLACAPDDEMSLDGITIYNAA
jgi:energy-converting hydrogenase Eha subunit E